MVKVYKEPCKNCWFTKDRIVSPERAAEILQTVVKEQSHFICHNASINDEDIMCKRFYDDMGHYSQIVRIADRLNAVKFIEQNQKEKLLTYIEMNAGSRD